MAMTHIRIRRTIVIIIALSGVIINAGYGIGLLKAFFETQYNNEIREILISAIVLEFGWSALLVWVIFKPFERRHILLFTIIPILLGNILHGINQFGDSRASIGAIALNTVIGLLYSGFYVVAYFLGYSDDKRR